MIRVHTSRMLMHGAVMELAICSCFQSAAQYEALMHEGAAVTRKPPAGCGIDTSVRRKVTSCHRCSRA